MAEQEELLIEEPYNPTDHVVKFEPELGKPSVATTYDSSKESDNSDYESTKSDGFDTPIVLLNQQVIPAGYIKSLVIDYRGFLPSLEIIVNDPRNEIQYIGGPGLRNFVAVILCPNNNGTYRKIALPFYIKDRINLKTDEIKYVCEYYNLGLTDVKSMQIGDGPLTTYEFCEKVAKELHLGFAATDNCENITDKRYRQSYSQRFKDFIQNQINISGLDKDSVFDAWIDTHGYLVLTNVSWVFDTTVKPENLTVVVQPQIEIPIKNNSEQKEPYRVQRTLMDMENYPINNLVISKKYNKLDTNKTTESGTDASFWILKSAGDQNILEMQDIQMEENSIEGKDNAAYKFRKSTFLGCEMDEDNPYMIQEQIRKHWLEKKRSKLLIVELNRPNYGLERGTLINVGVIEYDPAKMRTISQNLVNVEKETKVEDAPAVINDEDPPIDLANATDGNIGVLNPALSGMFYIDGMKYVYDNEINKVIQVLYLIKRSEDNNLFHAKASPNITSEQDKVLQTQNISGES